MSRYEEDAAMFSSQNGGDARQRLTRTVARQTPQTPVSGSRQIVHYAYLSWVVDGLCAGEKRRESIQGLWRAFGHAAGRKRAGMHATARTRSRYRQPIRANQQWGVCRHAQECRERTIQYEQELESTQETIRNHAIAVQWA
jgi:hypothetical protein